MSKANDFLRGIQEMGKFVSDKFYLTSLKDTPNSYENASGQYLVVNDNESGIHFTGIEKIASDLTDYGFGGSNDKVIPRQYEQLPSASNNRGEIISSGCSLYFSCNGEWLPVGDPKIATTDFPGCVESIEDIVLYQEYVDKFNNENLGSAFDKMLNNEVSLSEFIFDVCLFSNNKDSGSVKIDETTYKWGKFTETTTVNITATPSRPGINFVRWEGQGAVFGSNNDAQTTLLVDKDLSVTAYFNDTALNTEVHIQSNTTDGNDQFSDLSANNHEISKLGQPIHSSSDVLFGSTSLYFDKPTPNCLEFDINSLNNSSFTIECWFKLDSSRKAVIMRHASDFNLGTDALTSFSLYTNSSKINATLNLNNSNRSLLSANTTDLTTWNHVAIVRDNDQPAITLYVNGESVVTQSINKDDLLYKPSLPMRIGTFFSSDSSWTLGPTWIQDFRISRFPIYTSNFTPPNNLL